MEKKQHTPPENKRRHEKVGISFQFRLQTCVRTKKNSSIGEEESFKSVYSTKNDFKIIFTRLILLSTRSAVDCSVGTKPDRSLLWCFTTLNFEISIFWIDTINFYVINVFLREWHMKH